MATVLVILVMCGVSCASRRVTSTPPGALVYLGTDVDDLVSSGFRTPYVERDLNWKPMCIQARMIGFDPSPVVCLPGDQQDREVHFDLARDLN
ncbi:MAG: hypothetical protein AB1689_06010 [Thermodesulfobacteriota bacterium]